MFGGAYLGYYSAEQKSTTTNDHTLADAETSVKAPEAESTDTSKPTPPPHTEETASVERNAQEKLAAAIEDRFGQPLDQLLPHGITQIEGRGGKGFRQQVKSYGTWYPIFDLSKANTNDTNDTTTDDSSQEEIDPDSVELAEVALSIISSSPPRSRVGQTLQYSFQAVGGQPPYTWSMLPSPGPEFTLEPATGNLSAELERETHTTVVVTVSDTMGDTASAVYEITVQPKEPLSILNQALEPAVAGTEYSTQCTAKGGVKPYVWSLATTHPELDLDSTTGLLQGTPSESGEQILEVQVTDAQETTATATLVLRVTAGVEIITPSELPPVSPQSVFSQKLEATGGTPPYRWRLVEGALPQDISLKEHGLLKGIANSTDAQHEFTIAVQDKLGTSYEKTFRFRIEQGFIAIPSRNCVGLAWRSEHVSASLAKELRAVSVSRDGTTIYTGTATHWVDEGVPYGSHVYALTAIDGEGRTHPYSTTTVRVLEATLGRATPGKTADPYADAVRQFNPLSAGGYGAGHVPLNVTGPPDAKSNPINPPHFIPVASPTALASLHASTSGAGSIVLEFTDNIVRNGPGVDFTIFENVLYIGGDPNNRFIEPAVVEVALWPGEWYHFPYAINQPADKAPNYSNPGYYALGFAGVSGSTGEDPTDPSKSGGDSFDISALSGPVPLSWFRYIRISSTGHEVITDLFNKPVGHTNVTGALSGQGSSGFDLDAVSAVHW
jgi:hypothetical protein